ncbi:MAG: PEP-CTERM sorting domain-containing protein [Roseibacillus sp.]|nr:PEP-CTERM sorting domain-containing protein [Roseibacillus sp.]
MKLKYVVALLGAMSASAFGASITVTNAQGPVNTQAVVDNSGAPVDVGFAAFGTLAAGFDVTTLSSGADLASAFSIFDGAVGAIGPVQAGPFSIPGVYNVSNAGGALGAAAGAPLFLVLGNGADFASSTQAAILRVGDFPAAEPATATIFVNTGAEGDTQTTLLGDWSSFTVSPGIGSQPALALQNIPEPSSSLLIGLAGLSFLIRRRR